MSAAIPKRLELEFAPDKVGKSVRVPGKLDSLS